MEALASANYRSHEVDTSLCSVVLDLFVDGGLCLRDHGFPRFWAVLGAEFGKEEAEEVIDLCDGGDGGFATTT